MVGSQVFPVTGEQFAAAEENYGHTAFYHQYYSGTIDLEKVSETVLK